MPDVEELLKRIAEQAERIKKLEAVAQSLLDHRNCWFADQEEAMEAAGYTT